MFVANFVLKTAIQRAVVTLCDFIDYGALHPAREMKRIALTQSVDYIQEFMTGASGVESGREVLETALKEISPEGHCLEFGVYKGGTIRFIAKQIANRTIHGFDSFLGLPERWMGDTSSFVAKGKPTIRQKNVRLHVGLFAESLPRWLDENPGSAAFIHIDSDIYSSAKCVLELLEPRIIPGTIIVFDEYFNYPGWLYGEHKAFRELKERCGLHCEYLAYARFQVALRITATKSEINGHRLVEVLLSQ
jgi:predicted O-methyltransferase YrrM